MAGLVDYEYDFFDEYQSEILAELPSIEQLVRLDDETAAEQGSASADVVPQNYLSDTRARKLRREYVRERLAAAFEANEG